jgi:WhiB family transcriptional regulator, redox-sensing transcriptional regulator
VPSLSLLETDGDRPSGPAVTPVRPAAAPVDVTETFSPFPCQAAASADLWFAEGTVEVERAKALCGPCPIRRACLAGALERAEPWGVWGGEVFVGGAVVARKRGRGRPRKAESGAPR